MSDVGPMELLLLGLVALILFGPKKMPELGRSLGNAIREFRESVGGITEVKEVVNTVGEVRNAARPSNLAGALLGAGNAQKPADAVTGESPAVAPRNDGGRAARGRPVLTCGSFSCALLQAMSRGTIALIVIAGAALAAAALLGRSTPAEASGRVDATRAGGAATDVSANWSGYAATAGTSTFTDVTGTWKIPTATCTPGNSSSAAIWVGLGGYAVNSQYLEQTGTSSDCSTLGQPSYYIWYELVRPGPGGGSVNVKLKVDVGDTVTASVLAKPAGILVQVKDRTRKTSFTKQLTMSDSDLSSAEWIVEAPSECTGNFCRVVPLTNFGSVTFSNVAATAGAVGGTLSANQGWTLTNIQLVPQTHHFFGDPENGEGSSGAGASPTAPTPDGKSFTVNYNTTTASDTA